MRSLALLALAACSSSAPPPAEPVTPTEAPADASVAPIEVDARPDIRLSATAYVFRYASKARTETWTLWFGSGVAVLNVQPDGGALTQYQGSVTEGATLQIEVESATAKMKLECKRTKREVDATCDAAKPKARKKTTIDALDCFHADFKEPMPFGALPGIEYVAEGACAGYRAVPPTKIDP